MAEEIVRQLSSDQLLGIFREVRRPTQFLSNALATGVVRSESDRIEFDFEETGEVGLAPFVRPCDEGLATRGTGWNTKWFRPAYVKMKDAINVCDNTPSWYAGERPYSRLSINQRFNLHRAQIFSRHNAMLEQRHEWMAAKLAADGGYPISFQGPSGAVEEVFNIDFGRPASLNFVPAITWDQPNATPVKDLETWIEMHGDAAQATPTLAICGRNVRRNLVAHEDWNDVNKAGNAGRIGSFDLTRPLFEPLGAARIWGNYAGMQYWSYTGQYTAADGTRKDYIPPNTIIFVAPRSEYPVMTKFFGAIKDLQALRVQEVFQKEWIEEDPSALQMLTQSAPLLGTLNANQIAKATVL